MAENSGPSCDDLAVAQSQNPILLGLLLFLLELLVANLNCMQKNCLAKVLASDFFDERDPACYGFANSEVITTVLD